MACDNAEVEGVVLGGASMVEVAEQPLPLGVVAEVEAGHIQQEVEELHIAQQGSDIPPRFEAVEHIPL